MVIQCLENQGDINKINVKKKINSSRKIVFLEIFFLNFCKNNMMVGIKKIIMPVGLVKNIKAKFIPDKKL